MTEPLAVRYRPKTFEEMVGQRLNAAVLAQMVANHQVPTGMLFSGPSGTGKTTAARILARALDPEADPALAVIEIDAASHGGVADVRSLIESLRYSSGGEHRVVILDEAQSLTREAFNALLKPLEEPPPGTLFVLVTTEPHKIPETVASRLLEFEFRRVTPSEIYERLMVVVKAEGFEATPGLIQYLSQQADGSVRRALMDLDKAMHAHIFTVEKWVESSTIKNVAPRLLSLLVHGQIAQAFEELDSALSQVGHPMVVSQQITRCLRDLLVLRSGGTISETGESLQNHREMASRLEIAQILAALRIVWDLKTKVRQSEDPRGSLDIALALVGETFLRGRQIPSVVVAPSAHSIPEPKPVSEPIPDTPPAPRKLTLAELK